MWTIRSHAADETRILGRRLAQAAEPGLVVCLQGNLGAGKTCFAQGVGEGLAVGDDIVSPTFTLIAEHEDGHLPLLHADLYRLDSYAELQNIGFEELLDDWPGVSLIEWGDRFPDAIPTDRLWVNLQIEKGDTRVLIITASGLRSARVLARWQCDG